MVAPVIYYMTIVQLTKILVRRNLVINHVRSALIVAVVMAASKMRTG